jgi:Family of unknown function (DUF6768)
MTMEHIDDELHRVFQSDGEAPAMDADREESIGEMIAQSFRGQTRWLTLFAGMKISGTLAIAVLSAIFFFATESTKAHIALASVFVASLSGCMLWWMWYWLLVQRNSQAREIKRLELQVAKLASALRR